MFINPVIFNSLMKECLHISIAVCKVQDHANPWPPQLFLATLHPGGVAPLPGKEASLGEGQSSFSRTGRHESCHDLSPVTPLALPNL